MRKIGIYLLAATLMVSGCRREKEKITGLVAEQAMVVTAREEASAIGLKMIQKGGNAFDAMAATELALAVAYPFAGTLGGGGFMVYRMADGETGALDYREKAPMAAHRDMYLDSLGNVIDGMSRTGATAAGVPGVVAGVFAAHEKFGSLPMSVIMDEVIALAKRGVVVTEKQEKRLENYREEIIEVSGDTVLFAQAFKAGDTIRYDALAKTLSVIKEQGKDGFYRGEIAEELASFVQKNGGFITEEDLAAYEAVWRDPVSFQYKNLKVISMPPPSSGGITLGQIMGMIEPYELSEMGHNEPESIQLIVEAERRAYADRNHYLGDPDFVTIPREELLNKNYLKDRMAGFSLERATPSEEIEEGKIMFAESMETTHYSIVDNQGNAVSVTTTLNGAYGSKLYHDDLGIFLNNEMDDFSSKPGVPNMFGLIGGEANSIAPGKRMLSSMTPTIVEKDDDLFMVVGSPGGSTIITTVLQVILNVYEYEMGMQEAVNQPRFHHQWLPDVVLFEPDSFEPETLRTLEKRGYHINEDRSPILGKVNAILALPDNRLEGGADPRGDDKAAGY
ncbi:gamma-glutamyltransferase [Robertkochia aurantiaca]|uniref:gamma-glutamyltransferase n=1 Tax=Robertkochia aurantiaca TaxID=2873700 RepID=UPI001CCAF7D8|nr:gamma-glutamyltransferase [Robertkochia sp. 3YJGBD-33]